MVVRLVYGWTTGIAYEQPGGHPPRPLRAVAPDEVVKPEKVMLRLRPGRSETLTLSRHGVKNTRGSDWLFYVDEASLERYLAEELVGDA